ncbi:unnamed protein product [Urochloa humidicola]
MRGRRRLKVALVGELRWRWAATANLHQRVDGGPPPGAFQSVPSEVEYGEWLSPWGKSKVGISGDPLTGLRPDRSSSRFWRTDGDSTDDGGDGVDSPSAASIFCRAEVAGISANEVVEAESLLHDDTVVGKVVAAATPESMDRSVILARRVVAAIVQGGRKHVTQWKGPLRAPRVSPPLTFGDCPMRRVQAKLGHR